MADFYDGHDTEPFEVSCHVGTYGGIIIPIGLNDINGTYISLSPLEAKDLIALLQNEIEQYKSALNDEEDVLSA